MFEEFEKLDDALSRLAKSDSSIQYASHIRDEFDDIIIAFNRIKKEFDLEQKNSDQYFE